MSNYTEEQKKAIRSGMESGKRVMPVGMGLKSVGAKIVRSLSTKAMRAKAADKAYKVGKEWHDKVSNDFKRQEEEITKHFRK